MDRHPGYSLKNVCTKLLEMVSQGWKLICITTVVMSHKHESVTKQSLFRTLWAFSVDVLNGPFQQVGTPAQCVGMRIWWKLSLAVLACTHACSGTTLAIKTGREVWIPLYTEGREALIFARDAITSLSHIEEIFWKLTFAHSSYALILFSIIIYPAHKVTGATRSPLS